MEDEDRVIYYAGNSAPNIVRTLSMQDLGDFDIVPGQSFRLRVRPMWSDEIVLDVAMLVDTATDTITYVPQASDFAQEGVYRAWVYVTLASSVTQDTDEFDILVRSHGPGEGTAVSSVYRAARALEPVAWDSLKNYPDYGDVELQRVIELAKLRVAGSAVAVADEADLDPRVVDYIAKQVLANNVLYAAISFWTNQFIQQSSRGNSDEVITYPDRIRAAEAAIVRYREDLARQLPEIEPLVGSTSTYDAPMLSEMGPLLTPGLGEYPAHPGIRQSYPWGWPR